MHSFLIRRPLLQRPICQHLEIPIPDSLLARVWYRSIFQDFPSPTSSSIISQIFQINLFKFSNNLLSRNLANLTFFASRRIAKTSPLLSRDIFLPEGGFLRGHRLKASINHRAAGQSFTKETFEVSELPWPK